MKNKKALIIAIYTILFLSITILANYPATYSKYIAKSNADNNLKYISKVVSVPVDQTKTLSAPTINGNFAKFTFSLTPNPAAYGVADNYSINVPNGCYASNYAVAYAADNNNRNDINITVNCSIDQITADDQMSVTFTILEQIIRPNTTGFASPFRYAEYTYSGSYISQIEEPPVVEDPIIDEPTTPEVSITNKVLNYLLSNNETYEKYQEEITSYLNSVDLNTTNLLGLTINEDTYEVDNNFLGYARTYYENNEKASKIMIFSSSNSEEIENSFEYYLNTYYKDSNTEAILEYAGSQNKISSVILDNNYISGFNYQDSKLTIEDDVMTYASITKEILSMIESDSTITPDKYIIKDNLLVETTLTDTYIKVAFANIKITDTASEFKVTVTFNDNHKLTEEEITTIMEILKSELSIEKFDSEYELKTDNGTTTLSFKVTKVEIEQPDNGDNKDETETPEPDDTEKPTDSSDSNETLDQGNGDSNISENAPENTPESSTSPNIEETLNQTIPDVTNNIQPLDVAV